MRKLTTSDFVEKAKKVHSNEYDYSKVKYVGSKEKICIICPKHGEFWQTPDNHVSKGQKCPKCIGRTIKTKEDFIDKAIKIHKGKYSYDKTNYINSSSKVCIICPIHGEFYQTPNHHLSGNGCPKCNGKNMETKDFIKKAEKVHGKKYDYSKTIYKSMKENITITCHKHGDYQQTPSNHLSGRGCPKCNESHLEHFVRTILEENNINYTYQKHFSWLGKQSLDFYLPKYNIAIECQGIQHYKPIDFSGKGKEWAEELFRSNMKRDKIKQEKVKRQNIKLLYINEGNKNNILNEIKEWEK